jgi:DNA-binding transcriptional ArsR family regulator
MSPRSARAAAPIFAALGEPTRLALVHRLGQDGPSSITRLTDGGDVTRQAVSKHLAVLERAGLVRGEARGRERIWELAPERLEVARSYLDHIEARWDEALERLRDLVEK